MKDILTKGQALSRAYEDFERCTQDRDMRELAYARERFQLDQRSNLGAARREGLQEGLEKGMEKGAVAARREIAKAMLAQGLDALLIEQTTGISRDELENMQQSGATDSC